jgi:dipeptidase D
MDEKVKNILNIFEHINAIPRCSGQEAELSKWIQNWAKENGFNVQTDKAGNLVVNVLPDKGYENAPAIVIQGHMDMVCEKTPDYEHNFAKHPIVSVYDGDWLKAKGTSLGADNGIAIAISMAIATDKSIGHPRLELLFTVEEETGLIGAAKLEPGFIKGKMLINLDSEDEGVFTIGCAGGIDSEITLPLEFSELPQTSRPFKIDVKGLCGGHSGIDIDKQRANANKIIARALHKIQLAFPTSILSVKGGSVGNAIPRDANALIACDPIHFSGLENLVSEFEKTALNEFCMTEKSLSICIEHVAHNHKALSGLTSDTAKKAVNLLLAIPHGVTGMSADIQGKVETSNNLASIRIKDELLHILTSQRSFTMSKLDEIAFRVKAIADLAGAHTKASKQYPPWSPDTESVLLNRCIRTYKHLFHKEPVLESIHAGLECAVIGSKYPGIEMISLGPDIQNPHSPDERMHIPSIKKIWDFLVALFQS